MVISLELVKNKMNKVTKLSTLSIVAALVLAGIHPKPACSENSYPRALDSQSLFDPIRLGISKSTSLVEAEARLMDKMRAAVANGDLNTQALLTNDIGLVDLLEGKVEESKQFISQSLSLREQLYGVTANPCADSLNGLAAVALAKNDYLAAEHNLAAATLIEAKSSSTNDLQIADSLDLKSRLLLAQGKFVEAQRPSQYAKQLRTNLLGLSSPAVAESNLTNGLCSLQKGDAKTAAAEFQESLNSFDSTLITPESLMALALIQLNHGDLTAANDFYKQSLAAQTRLLGAANLQIAAYKGLYLKQLWKHNHFMTAIALKNELGAVGQQERAPDYGAGLLQTSFLKAASSGLTSNYQLVHITFCALVGAAALLLTAIMVAAKDLILPLPKGDGFNDFLKANKPLHQTDELNALQSLRQRQPVKSGKLPLVPDLDYVPNWNKFEE